MTVSKDKDKVKPPIDFMPGWAKDEACYKEAIVRDYQTKKIVEGGWPRQKPTEQAAYENWLDAVVNPDTGEFYHERNSEGIPIKSTTAKYVVTVMTRIRDTKNRAEHLTSKGKLIGYDVTGRKIERHIKDPEKWRKTVFAYERTYNEKTGSHTSQTIGPGPDTHDYYELHYTADNVRKLYEKVEDDDVMFVLKDLRSGDARSVNWSSAKDTLELFMNKPFEYLWRADYMPAPVKQELRQEAIAQGLIHGVQSDYAVQASSGAKGGAYT